MKNLLNISILLLLPLCSFGQGWMPQKYIVPDAVAGEAPGGGACSETPDMAVTNVATLSHHQVNGAEARVFLGSIWPNNQAATNICKLGAALDPVGDCSAKFYTMRIYNMSGGNILTNSIVATSDTLTGITGTPRPVFTFSTPAELAANTAYAKVVYNSDASGNPLTTTDASNYMKLYFNDGALDQVLGERQAWDISGTAIFTADGTKDYVIDTYFFK